MSWNPRRMRAGVALAVLLPGIAAAQGSVARRDPPSGRPADTLPVVPPMTLRGVVWAAPSGRPVGGAKVWLPGAGRGTWTDRNGAYEIPVPPGTSRVQVTHRGFAPATFSLAADARGAMQLDVTLAAEPVDLPRLVVSAQLGSDSAAGTVADPDGIARSGRTLAPDDAPTFGAVDALTPAAITPDGVVSGPDPGAALYIRGGSADQNRVLLDGVPLYHAWHLGRSLSILDPALVERVRLEAETPPASIGGAISSVLDVGLPAATPRQWSTHGNVVGGLARVAARGPLPGAGSLAVSARVPMLPAPATGDWPREQPGTARDAFASARFPTLGGAVTVVGLASTDYLGSSPADGTAAAPDLSTGRNHATSAQQAAAEPARAYFARRGHTLAVIWHGDSTPTAARSSVRIWTGNTVTEGRWVLPPGPVDLQSSLASTGASAEVAWPLARGRLAIGGEAERLTSRYDTWPAAASRSADGPVTRITAAPYVDLRWQPARRWQVMAGLRHELAAGGWSGLEPRAALRYQGRSWLALSASAGRVHQATQSLNNSESVLDGILGGALPVATRGDLARADRVSAGAVARLGAHLVVTADAYASRLGGLRVVAPVTAQPFALDSVASADGWNRGQIVGLTWADHGASVRLAYGRSEAGRRTTAMRYAPSAGTGEAFVAVLQATPFRHTIVRSSFWTASGRRTTIFQGDLEWTPAPLDPMSDISGGIAQWQGPIGAGRLPAASRVDIGIARSASVSVGGRPLEVVATAGVLNALNHGNVRAIEVAGPGGPYRTIRTLPRTLLVGVSWRF